MPMTSWCDGCETPCPMHAMSRLPCPRSRLPCPRSRLPCPRSRLPCPRSRLPCPRSQLPCTRSHLPCPSFYLPEYTSHSDWLHHNNFIYIVILNYILSSEQQNRPSQQGNAPRPGGCRPLYRCRPPLMSNGIQDSQTLMRKSNASFICFELGVKTGKLEKKVDRLSLSGVTR